ncbi:hypothetical protein [Desulfurivibrio alkaliphilus]|uniref:Uncharacterized protein n=1 Tax=Desulfurivibrio alkaliphilus (strain DSM 19089 / UNIQEM U267 / AHT2) TaxID=589865 RepID=D6YZQ6_DESAT|nr:hypothetical protein [Desulfurivibrio alkaliphilus]ADH85063.1 hypothetical protein DaAHT2_0357 [Desulfurivibrio alkaliphilus AHT 2]
MEGTFQEGWYTHPTLGLIRVFTSGSEWVYVCYTSNGRKALSRERPLDGWTWALSEPSHTSPSGFADQ